MDGFIIASYVFWFLSFMSQLIENCKMRDLKGLALLYIYGTAISYISLSIYVTVSYSDTNENVVDLIFAWIFIGQVIILVIQTMCLFRQGDQSYVCFQNIFSIIYPLIAMIYGLAICLDHDKECNIWTVLEYGKKILIIIKYLPQFILNCYNESTQGWSIFNVIFDMLGWICQIISKHEENEVLDWFERTVPLLWGCIFICQHCGYIKS